MTITYVAFDRNYNVPRCDEANRELLIALQEREAERSEPPLRPSSARFPAKRGRERGIIRLDRR
jgi:hypothetical protein